MLNESAHPLNGHGDGCLPFARHLNLPPPAETPREIQELLDAARCREREWHKLEGTLKKLTEQVSILFDATAEVAGNLDVVAKHTGDEYRRLRTRDLDHHLIAPVARALIAILDRLEADALTIEKSILATRAQGRAVDKRAANFLRESRSIDWRELIAALKFLSVEPYTTAPGSPFDAQRQKPLETVATADAKLDGRLVKTVRPGYERVTDGWVLRPEWVVVHAYEPETKSANNERK